MMIKITIKKENACASYKDLNQPAHPRSLIRVFAVRIKNFSSLIIQNVTREDSIRLHECVG